MNGVHDMGGMHGFGPIVREADEPLFHAAWEARVRAMTSLSVARAYFTIEASRHGIERIPPADYLGASYFERWLAALETNLIEGGFLSAAELDERTAWLRQHPDAAFSRRADADLTRHPEEEHDHPSPPAPEARFAIGDPVITRHDQPVGHTRLPRYARGKRGLIERLYGAQTFPDTNAHGLGKQPQPLYRVRFDGRELWGDSAEPRQTVSLDLWQSYLEPASP